MKITALAGGVGASKFLAGLHRVMNPEDLSIVVNTGDDIKMFGLYIAPDLDIVTYTLAGAVNPATGWGLSDESFNALERLTSLTGSERWFNLGDKDLATHIFRTQLMGEGVTLGEVADRLRRHFGLAEKIIPMTNTHTPTTIITGEGDIHFQEYLIRRRAEPQVRAIRFENIEQAVPAPGVIEAIRESDGVIICPSNPLISIGPILAVPGIRKALTETPAKVLAISPVVGGESLKGPTDRMLRDLGMEVSAGQVARLFADLLDYYLLDQLDAGEITAVEELGIKASATQTIMRGDADKVALARTVLDIISGLS